MSTRTQAAIAAAQALAIGELLDLITADAADVHEAGRRALVLAFLLEPSRFNGQQDLARRLGVSKGRASQVLNHIRRRFPATVDCPLNSK